MPFRNPNGKKPRSTQGWRYKCGSCGHVNGLDITETVCVPRTGAQRCSIIYGGSEERSLWRGLDPFISPYSLALSKTPRTLQRGGRSVARDEEVADGIPRALF